ncbi:hypothetical protein FH972_023320 [Carpinus fangiana]|uniref:Xylanolytic transcriptional activator regulatory domain-containing protein n=1 Tax=Carpinus fangiana TaxID=176857 RepID=A0A5N6KUW1_9ROSI|nr:hypothetical protein FH972_023320 [Carpinus fangiana]
MPRGCSPMRLSRKREMHSNTRIVGPYLLVFQVLAINPGHAQGARRPKTPSPDSASIASDTLSTHAASTDGHPDLEEAELDDSDGPVIDQDNGYIGRYGFEDRTTTGTVLRVLLERLDLGQEYKYHVENVTQDLSYNPDALPKRRPCIVSMPKLPPLDVAMEFYAAQYAYIGTIFAFVRPHVFKARLQWAYEHDLDLSVRDSCLAYCQVLLILAFGQLYSVNRWDSHDGPPGFSFFSQALQFLPDLHEEGSLLGVEVGLALRMAISLGLHQEIDDPSLTDEDKEHRRRLWWSVYSMDRFVLHLDFRIKSKVDHLRILCAKSGHPITILDDDIGVAPPSRLMRTEPEYSPATVLYHYTELSKILGQILNRVYRKRPTGSALKSNVQSVMRALENWHRNIPHALRPTANSSRETVSTFLHYYQCINMTARPLLFHVVQRRLAGTPEDRESDWRSGRDSDTVKVIDLCIAAARDSTNMLHTAAKQNLVGELTINLRGALLTENLATYGYMDGEHAFSAAIILVMANIAFPANDRDQTAMEMALNVLDGMARKGNTHIRAKLQVLYNIRASMSAGTTIMPEDISCMDHEAQVPTNVMVPHNVDPHLLMPNNDELPWQDTFGFEFTGNTDDWETSYGQFPLDVVNQDWAGWAGAASSSAPLSRS